MSKYHLIGIGGIGMSAIAHLVLERGLEVSGSDLKTSSATEDLKRRGAKVFIGHAAGNIHGADLVVYSSAIKEDNPEIAEAKRLNIPLIKRAQALAELMKDKTVITVSGSHGKTTTTSLVSYLLLEAGLLPTMAVGGILKNIDSNACLGKGDFFVAEADESDGSFLYYTPRYSIITNIDREHLDYYKEFNNLLLAFREFLNRTQAGGCVFGSNDDLNLRRLLKDYKNRSVLFGLSEDADIYAGNIELKGLSSGFDCFYQNKFLERFHLALGGRHNVSNALAVIALGLELGIDRRIIKAALINYKGSRRRMEVKLRGKKYLVLDDYAHHPTEIKATLEALKGMDNRRLIAVFQPHRYSRTKLLLDEFGRSFDAADYLIVTDIYAASEPALEGVDARLIIEKVKSRSSEKPAVFLPKEDIVEHILGIIKPNDLVVTLGAGDIIKTCDELVQRLKG